MPRHYPLQTNKMSEILPEILSWRDCRTMKMQLFSDENTMNLIENKF